MGLLGFSFSTERRSPEMPKKQCVRFVVSQSPFNAGERAGFDPEVAERMFQANVVNFVDEDGNTTRECKAVLDRRAQAEARKKIGDFQSEVRTIQGIASILVSLRSSDPSQLSRLGDALAQDDDDTAISIIETNGLGGATAQNIKDAWKGLEQSEKSAVQEAVARLHQGPKTERPAGDDVPPGDHQPEKPPEEKPPEEPLEEVADASDDAGEDETKPGKKKKK
jgi:hypothetical protein